MSSTSLTNGVSRMAVSAPKIEEKLSQLHQSLQKSKAPSFGHACYQLYSYDEGYVAMNNGSFGACPKYVGEALRLYLDESERSPDYWNRGGFRPHLNKARKLVADAVKCQEEDVVMVANATTGVGAVLRGFQGQWSNSGTDAILTLGTIYGACDKAAQYVIDSNPHLRLRMIRINVTYPIKHDDFLKTVEAGLQKAKEDGVKIRIAMLDAISSLPGVLVPWESLVQLLRRYEILSLVDGAHAVGQIELDLTKADPDFFVSNCHKWMSAHRAVAFLYVPKRNQHLVPGMPTSWHYISPTDEAANGHNVISTDAPSNFVAQWEYIGTKDMSNALSLPAAIEFRQWLGGEAAIISYTTQLAFKGGQILARTLGGDSVVMDNDSEKDRLTASMVNVSIPINLKAIDSGKFPSLTSVSAHLQFTLSTLYSTFVPFYAHDDKVWIRVSAQIWLEESDFTWLGEKIADIITDLGWLQKSA